MKRLIYAICSVLFSILKISSLIIHLWSIIIAFNWGGFLAAIATLFLPLVSQIFWAGFLWSESGTFINPYTLTIVIFLPLFVVVSFIRTYLRFKLEGSVESNPEIDEINNEALRRLWNNSDIRAVKKSTNEILPNSIAENEVVVNYNDLIESGYIGKPPDFNISIGRFLIYAHPILYKDYWIRGGKAKGLYSIFKEEK